MAAASAAGVGGTGVSSSVGPAIHSATKYGERAGIPSTGPPSRPTSSTRGSERWWMRASCANSARSRDSPTPTGTIFSARAAPDAVSITWSTRPDEPTPAVAMRR